jgi:PhzF family phenazine biosynthesis protein
MKLEYTTLDVFTSNRFAGNPLAIVRLPSTVSISQETKQLIAKEFNLSETVFLHEPASGSPPTYIIDIFTADKELPFAGHPTVGSGCFLFSKNPDAEKVVLRTKAGDILVLPEPKGVRLQVPEDFRVHSPYGAAAVKRSQLQLKNEDYVNGSDGAEPVVSIVKGMTFMLLQLASEDALRRLQPFPEKLAIPDEHLGDWKGFKSLYCFVQQGDGSLRTRMFNGSLEDPATGSAASTLGGYLAMKKGAGEWKFKIVQGVEMGRRSDLTVVVKVGEGGELEKIELAGEAVQVQEGKLVV